MVVSVVCRVDNLLLFFADIRLNEGGFLRDAYGGRSQKVSKEETFHGRCFDVSPKPARAGRRDSP